MFNQNNIRAAIERFWSYCSEEEKKAVMDFYDENLGDMSLDLLTELMVKKAKTIPLYAVFASVESDGCPKGDPLLTQKAYRIMNCNELGTLEPTLHIRPTSELWLTEDMQYVIVYCVSAVSVDSLGFKRMIEHRIIVKTIESEDDMYFEPVQVLQRLNDACMFYELAKCAGMEEEDI